MPPDPPEGWTEGIEEWVEKWRSEWKDEIGRRDGDPLWPDRWPAALLRRLRAGLLRRGRSSTWEALYQQNPTPKEGGTFKVDNWRRIGKAPELGAVVRAWDLSASLRKGDWTVGVKMGVGPNNEVYVLHVARDRLDPAGVQNLVVATAAQDGYGTIVGMEEEKGASGKANTQTFAAKLIGYQFHAEPVSGSKELRAAGYAAHQGNGLVYLVADGTWDVDTFIEEHRTFPAGRHDDQVDAAALAFRMIAIGGFGPADADVIMPEDDLTPVARRAYGFG